MKVNGNDVVIDIQKVPQCGCVIRIMQRAENGELYTHTDREHCRMQDDVARARAAFALPPAPEDLDAADDTPHVH